MDTIYSTNFAARASNLELALEALVDGNDLPAVLEALSMVCYGKSSHVNENWQDKPLADTWQWAGRRLFSLADHKALAPLVYTRK
jgi:hypothetical protein